MKKAYYYKMTTQNGEVIFNHTSNDPARLAKMAMKAGTASDGSQYADWYFGTEATNIPSYYFM